MMLARSTFLPAMSRALAGALGAVQAPARAPLDSGSTPCIPGLPFNPRGSCSPAPPGSPPRGHRAMSMYHIEAAHVDPPNASETFRESMHSTLRDVLSKKESKYESVGRDGWVSTRTTVYDAVKKMAEEDKSALLVMDFDVMDANNDGEISVQELRDSVPAIRGVLTERDYVTKVVLRGLQSKNTLAEDIMTPHDPASESQDDRIIMLSPETTVVDAMDKMIDSKIRHIPVVKGNQLLGMVSIRDVVEWVVREQRTEVHHMREYISGHYPGQSKSGGGTDVASQLPSPSTGP